MRWYRWREKWAWGFGDWRFAEYGNESTEVLVADTIGEDNSREHDHSDKYRGVEVEEILAPPPEYLRNLIKRERATAEQAHEAAARHSALLDQLERSR